MSLRASSRYLISSSSFQKIISLLKAGARARKEEEDSKIGRWGRARGKRKEERRRGCDRLISEI
jgi:hypothetical protein